MDKNKMDSVLTTLANIAQILSFLWLAALIIWGFIKRGRPPRPRPSPRPKPLFIINIVLTIVILLLSSAFLVYTKNPSPNPPRPIPEPKLTDLISLPDGQNVGISDGSHVFDLAPRDGSDAEQQHSKKLKQEGASAFRQGNFSLARQDWTEVIRSDNYPNDAESQIYLEDLAVTASKKPYITFILVVQLTGSKNAINRGRDDLQGAYVAQKEFNKKNGPVQVRLLIANTGDQDAGVTFVKGRILLAATKQEPTFVGTLGWPERTIVVNQALSELCKANIPIVSLSSVANLGSKSDCSFSVVPSGDAQAAAAANFAKKKLEARRVSVIYDPANPFSSSIADLFIQSFRDPTSPNLYRIVDKENYTLGHGKVLAGLVRATLRAQPDLIYFAGYPDDIGEVLAELQKEGASINVIGTNILYRASGSPIRVTSGSDNPVYFSTFAYPDEWSILQFPQQPPFITDYKDSFDPNDIHTNYPYGYQRANADAIIAYDAMCTILEATRSVLREGKTTLSLQELQKALQSVRLQGVSGQIQFDANGNAVDKAVIIVSVDAEDKNHYEDKPVGSYLCSSCLPFLSSGGSLE
jgi:eukaryotic-like serine/threonine-protein kinase